MPANTARVGRQDITALQALSRRVHYGKHVAEVKFREQPEAYSRLIEAGDKKGIMDLLTNSAVEARLLERVRLKAAAYGTGRFLRAESCLSPRRGSCIHSRHPLPVCSCPARRPLALRGGKRCTAQNRCRCTRKRIPRSYRMACNWLHPAADSSSLTHARPPDDHRCGYTKSSSSP